MKINHMNKCQRKYIESRLRVIWLNDTQKRQRSDREHVAFMKSLSAALDAQLAATDCLINWFRDQSGISEQDVEMMISTGALCGIINVALDGEYSCSHCGY